nr:MAG TPA: hypothetical protein [Caudoviricetes sp.]
MLKKKQCGFHPFSVRFIPSELNLGFIMLVLCRWYG